jgi:hypothetical protein
MASGLRDLVSGSCPAMDDQALVANATLGGTVQLWEWIGPEAACCFSY